MREDEDGDFWFVDRRGYLSLERRKCPTEQVAAVPSEPVCRDPTVYGVRIAGQEGRAGMAAIKLREGHSFDPAALFVCVENT